MKKIALLLLLTLVVGCGSDGLDEKTARSLIEREAFPIVYGVEIPRLIDDVDDSNRSAVNRLRKQGMLVYEYPEGGEAGVGLTTAGLSHLREEQVERFLMTGWRENLVEVSSFRLKEDGSGVAEVVIECDEVSPFAAAFSGAAIETPYRAQVRISRKKSGDGWRVSQPRSPFLRRLGNKGIEELPTWRPDPA